VTLPAQRIGVNLGKQSGSLFSAQGIGVIIGQNPQIWSLIQSSVDYSELQEELNWHSL